MKVKEIFDVASRIESVGYSYYRKMSEGVGQANAELFRQLAEEERQHREKFEGIYEDLAGTAEAGRGTWEEQEVGDQLRYLAELSIFPKLEEDDPPRDYEEALNHAIGVEKDSIIFYDGLRYLFKDEDPLEKIIAEERKHMMKLMLEKKA